MKAFATRRYSSALFVLACAACLSLPGARAEAQVSPLWDHYKVYMTPPFPVPSLGVPVRLVDQFGTYDHTVEQLEWFMNPTEKLVLGQPPPPPVTNPLLHYSWWRMTPQAYSATVTAQNQFGDHTIDVHDAIYLLNPALKNQTGSPPVANHYKCYFCQGPPANVQVQLDDQFGPFQTTVLFPRFWCNPVDKHVLPPTGGDYLVQDPNQHYLCYEFNPEDPTPHTAAITDQFLVNHNTPMNPSRYLCVPTYKTGVTETSKNTWGKLKQLYR
jgi:hypothetical protein